MRERKCALRRRRWAVLPSRQQNHNQRGKDQRNKKKGKNNTNMYQQKNPFEDEKHEQTNQKREKKRQNDVAVSVQVAWCHLVSAMSTKCRGRKCRVTTLV